MPRLNDLPLGESVSLLLYGSAGSGKTHLIGTAGSRTLIINTGLGITTLQSKGFRKHHPNINPIIETVQEQVLPDHAEAFDKCCDILDAYLNIKHPMYNEYDTVAIDDTTALKRFAMAKGLEVNAKEGKSTSLAKSKASGVIQKAVQDYGLEMDFIDQFIIHYVSECKRLNKHFILTAHERVEYNKPSKIGEQPTVNKIRPGFTGQTFPDSVTGHFDMVWRMEPVGAGERILYQARTAGDSSLVAKTRWAGSFKVIETNPNFLEIIQRIKNG